MYTSRNGYSWYPATIISCILVYTHFLILVKSAGTYYNDLGRSWFDLHVAEDGRIQAYIKGGQYFDEDDYNPYLQVFRNFIEINSHTGTLLISFGVAADDFRADAHIMTLTIGSGAVRTGPPRESTVNRPGWFLDNMILWFDEVKWAFVMIYQEGCYSCLSSEYDDWLVDYDLDALNQTLWKIVSSDDGATWTERQQILSGVVDPHVHFQIIPGLDVDEYGYPTEVLIPIHHLDEQVAEQNYQSVWRCNRAIDPDDGSWSVVNMSNSSDLDVLGGYIQASIVRPRGGKNLVAFLRDRNGWWMGRSESTDDGRSWANIESMPLPNADLMNQAIWLNTGKVMLVYNPQQSFTSVPDAGDRTDNTHILVVALSEDEGLSWAYSRTLEYAYDAMHEYPVGVKDTTCDNVFFTYSMESNEKDVSCSAITDEVAYEACVKKNLDMYFIKFTILHESWVLDDHNWGYDYEGCAFQISEELRMKMPISVEVEGFTSWMFATSVAPSPSHAIFIVLLVLIFLSFLCTCGFGLYLYRKRKLSVQVDQVGQSRR